MELGESNDQWVEVVGGLGDGDHVLLSAPVSSAAPQVPDTMPNLNLREGGRALQPH